ncbi:hypothetical protein KY360_03880 [Candidatus Woesearchaeota archaeon]|nr:hypothetical protein [Candidatus Woesearchaeota archaeon]
MVEDVSKNLVIVLIVVALIVSVVGTWIVSEKIQTYEFEVEKIGGTSQGNVGFTLIDRASNQGASMGNVGLTIISNG